MDISAHAFSLADRPRTGQTGHQGSQAPGRPVLHLVSSSRRPRQENGTMSSLSPDQCSSFVRAMRPFLRPGLLSMQGAARRGCQGWPLLRPPAGFGLDGPEHGCQAQAGRDAIARVFTHSNARSLRRTAQAMRASLLASAIASTLRCSRFLAASIQCLSPWPSHLLGFTFRPTPPAQIECGDNDCPSSISCQE